jgi:protoporphyrinogen oxidase
MGAYAVLGGGILGLATALRLLGHRHEVTVIERESSPGGLAAGFRPGPTGAGTIDGQDVWLEKFYHHLFRTDRAITALIAEVGLASQLQWIRPVTVTLHRGESHQLDSAASLLRFRPLPLADRVRMGLVLAYLRRLDSSEPLEGRTAATWIRRTMGPKAYDIVWGPLLRGKFGALADQVTLPWYWARVHDRTARLGYVRGGFQRFYERLAARVGELGGVIELGTRVHQIHTRGDGFAVDVSPTSGGGTRTETFQRVVSTLPTRVTCQLTPELPAAYRARYEWGQAYGAHCLILALDRALTRSYWMNITDLGYPFITLVEHTNYMPPRDYGGRHLIYLGNYRPMGDPLFSQRREEVMREFLPHLARINPAFEPRWVQDSWMFSAPYAQPIVTTDYRQHIPPFRTPLPGLYLANMFQVYPHDRGQNYSVELAERLVRYLEGAAVDEPGLPPSARTGEQDAQIPRAA